MSQHLANNSEILRRYEALHTTLRILERQLVQVIAPSLTIPLPVVDLRSLPATEQEAETQRLATEERSQFTPNPIPENLQQPNPL